MKPCDDPRIGHGREQSRHGLERPKDEVHAVNNGLPKQGPARGHGIKVYRVEIARQASKGFLPGLLKGAELYSLSRQLADPQLIRNDHYCPSQ